MHALQSFRYARVGWKTLYQVHFTSMYSLRVLNKSILVSLMIILLHYAEICSSLQSSALFVLSAAGRHLTEHSIGEHETNSVTECAHFCLRKSSNCKSINYRKRQEQHSNNCQLNNATKFTVQPQNFLPNNEYNYYEPIVNKEKQKNGANNTVIYEKSCDALYKSGQTSTGVYNIDPEGAGAFKVRCDMIPYGSSDKGGEGWTVFLKRFDGSLDFDRDWNDYKMGFGNNYKAGEFWLGLEKIHLLTANGQNILRVDGVNIHDSEFQANYENFTVGSEKEEYILDVGGNTGDAGDGLFYHNGMKFVTKDRDNEDDCAARYKSGWWFNSCYSTNPTGVYNTVDVTWLSHKIKSVEMKVGPAVGRLDYT